MKKKIKSVSPFGGKLSLNKRTISNLNTVEMNQKAGGAHGPTFKCVTSRCTQGRTCNGNCI